MKSKTKVYQQTALSSLDSYKLGHADQYPEGTTKVYSNFTPRSNFHFNAPDTYKTNEILWFGIQAFLNDMQNIWEQTFFSQNKESICKEFQEFVSPFVGPKGFNISRIERLHALGYLPLEIKALPEGSFVPVGVPVLTITNTHPDFYWLPNFLETWISSELWKPCTSATTSALYKKIITAYADATGGNKDFILWQGHDFSVRGMSGIIDSAKTGMGHLLSFLGTDNLPAVKAVNDYYGCSFVGGSVPASEHSVMCAGGEDSEIETFRRFLTTYPSGVVSIVSDTWDYWNVISSFALELKDDIMNRQPDSLGLAKTVFRPDSGDPVKIIVGDPDAPDGSLQHKGSVQVLWEIFGGSVNDKGYKTLNQRVGLIYGDSITPERCDKILKGLMEKGFASDNVVFGIGSYTFQYCTRDTLGFAMKATYVEINGEGKEIYKNPKTDNGTKKSAKGLLKVIKESGKYKLIDSCTVEEEKIGELGTIFLNGKILLNESFDVIRGRVNLE